MSLLHPLPKADPSICTLQATNKRSAVWFYVTYFAERLIETIRVDLV
jgi:hypothetical protein